MNKTIANLEELMELHSRYIDLRKHGRRMRRMAYRMKSAKRKETLSIVWQNELISAMELITKHVPPRRRSNIEFAKKGWDECLVMEYTTMWDGVQRPGKLYLPKVNKATGRNFVQAAYRFLIKYYFRK